ncbi:hypothetical protein [Adhaeribacter radiodurans]|uniref:Uncharacterized protein n=1 Tax=Adhaeribacter radiodurans TaxID=2745197 RepID=A0A7L7LAX1_9BACT|nr:hypothetical protein [Adhaeribacter radiodurans]QMU29970.1 hypothetical protein HUW48_18915 [Adhaeribacter radiodurans]
MSGDIVISSEDYKCTFAKLTNVNFKDNFCFKHCNLGIGVSFDNSTFDKKLGFYGSKASGFNKEFSNESTSLIINKCEISKLEFKQNNHFERGVNIKESLINELNISKLITEKGGIYIEGSTFEKKLDVGNTRLNGNGIIRIHKSKVHSKVRYQSINVSGITFTNTEFEKDVHIWGGESTDGIVFNENNFNDDVYIKGVKSSGSLTIRRDNFKKSVQIDFEDNKDGLLGRFKNIYISSVNFGISFTLNGANQEIESLLNAASQSLTGTVQFSSCSFKEAKIEGDNHKGNFVFNLCQFHKLTFKYFINFGNLILSSSAGIPNTNSEFQVYNSNLGKAQFFNVSLKRFDSVDIISSQVSEIITSGVAWFVDTSLLPSMPENSDKNKRKREIYRQLKQALEKQGDKIHALEFQAAELKSYEKQISTEAKFLNQNRIILWLGKTNDFGLNWVKPIKQVLIITLIFYFLIILTASDKLLLKPARNCFEVAETIIEFANFSYVLPQLINPARTLDRIFDSEANITLGFWAYLWDALQKIVLAFFIFQIISAFRKFIK